MDLIILDGRDVPHPEDLAMLQSLYSRSPQSVRIHLEKVRKAGSGKFMGQYYVGYGHKSIGDNGNTAMFAEGVSMLCAKAIQDTPLYNGQEASTRYLDMAAQPFLNPLGTSEGAEIQEAWRAIYTRALSDLQTILQAEFPRKDGQDEGTWKKAIKARAFDITRSLLPAGAATLVAWGANLRQANDHLKEMRHHVLPEVRQTSEGFHGNLTEKYTSSFNHERDQAEEDYVERSMAVFSFFDEDVSNFPDFRCTSKLDLTALSSPRLRDLLVTRPRRAELHQRFRRFGSIDFEFTLDFGSYRDLQRQRSAVQEMPLLTTRLGFHQWYLDKLPDYVHAEIESITDRVNALDTTDALRQYYIPMGYLVPVVMSCPLPSAVYIAELRAGVTVHPTLRIRAQQMGEAIKQCVPWIAMHHDMSPPDTWSIKRGAQDIVARSAQ